jgi:hypothetical protein
MLPNASVDVPIQRLHHCTAKQKYRQTDFGQAFSGEGTNRNWQALRRRSSGARSH